MSDETSWADSDDENEDREPRGLLLEALSRFGAGPHDAVDLGCGSGIDTIAILERGWSPAPDPRRATERPANMGPSIQTDGG
jgi:hypothetical protein